MFGAGKGPFWGCKTGFYLSSSQEESLGSPFPPVAAPQGALLGGDREMTRPWPWKEIPGIRNGQRDVLLPGEIPLELENPKAAPGLLQGTDSGSFIPARRCSGKEIPRQHQTFPGLRAPGGKTNSLARAGSGGSSSSHWNVNLGFLGCPGALPGQSSSAVSLVQAPPGTCWVRDGDSGCGMGAVGAGWGQWVQDGDTQDTQDQGTRVPRALLPHIPGLQTTLLGFPAF